MDMKYNFIVILMCISLITNDVDHISMFLLAICVFLKKCLFNICILKPYEMESKYFKFGLCGIILLTTYSTLYILSF